MSPTGRARPGARRVIKESGASRSVRARLAIAIGEKILRFLGEAALHGETGQQKENMVAPRRFQRLRQAVGGVRRFDQRAAGFVGDPVQASSRRGEDQSVGDQSLDARLDERTEAARHGLPAQRRAGRVEGDERGGQHVA